MSVKLNMKEKMARVRAHKRGGIAVGGVSVGGVPIGGFMNDDEYIIDGGVAIGGRRHRMSKKMSKKGGVAIGGRRKMSKRGGVSVGGYKKGDTKKAYLERTGLSHAIVPYGEKTKKVRSPRAKKLKPVKIPSAKKSLSILKKMLYPTKTMREKHGHRMGLGLNAEHLNQLVTLVEHWARASATGGYDISNLFSDVVKYVI
jgi:hypothetical protein